METIDNQDTVSTPVPSAEPTTFGKTPQPWQLRNNWAKPKRIRRRIAQPEIDLWEGEH